MLWSWDAKALSDAIARLDGALVTDNVSGFKRLVIRNLFLWILQPKPRDRPQVRCTVCRRVCVVLGVGVAIACCVKTQLKHHNPFAQPK